jgi:hypothetical protein
MANNRTGTSLFKELTALGQSTACLIESFNAQQLAATGTANGRPISVNAIGYVLCGHALHHTHIIKERYLDNRYVHAS